MRIPALALVLTAFVPLAAAAQALVVPLDQATRVSLPRPARDVIVGNDKIADATVLDARHFVLTGKGPGATNVMVTDWSGKTMLSRQVVVSASDANRVSIYRGTDVSVYACGGRCQSNAAPAAATTTMTITGGPAGSSPMTITAPTSAMQPVSMRPPAS
jgi:hypothetical protein